MKFIGLKDASGEWSYDNLRNLVGLEESEKPLKEGGWLAFMDNGKLFMVPSIPISISVTWYDLLERDLVFGKEVIIDGKTFNCRLIKGVSDSYDHTRGGFNIEETKGSEWDALFSLVHNGQHTDSLGKKLCTVETFGELSDEDLNLHRDFGLGSRSWCQEKVERKNVVVQRGYLGAFYLVTMAPGNKSITNGWRPILEEV
jgi:hypothetical protein